MPTIDVHQHLWPDAFVEALRRRARPPRLRGSILELASEEQREIDLGAHRLEARVALLDRHAIDVAVVSLPPTLGVDELPADEAAELVDAYETGILELAAASAGRIVPLAAGHRPQEFVGVCVPATAFVELHELAPRLDELERRGAFLFVHPGPGRRPRGAPDWWPAVVEYTAQLQSAYAAWLAYGAERWPDLKVVFASLAGGGPFQLERLRSWGVAGRDVLHENVFFETSSYGTRALELCLTTFGVGQLLFGSDVPVLDPAPALDAVRSFGDAVGDALCRQNPLRLLP
jgi:6-methylsalicylate decarboxylase